MKNCANKKCKDVRTKDPAVLKYMDKPKKHNGCNWLDWMVDEAGGTCPHCGGPVTEITTVTPLGRMMDNMRLSAQDGET